MIIIEGPDNSGKSTLCEKIAEIYSLPIVHAGGPSNGQDLIERGQKALYTCGQAVVQDRNFIISEQIYGLILRKKKTYILSQYEETLINISSPLIIYCRPSDERLLDFSNHQTKAHETEEHTKAVEKNQQLIVNYYDIYMMGIPHLKYDFENMSIDFPLNAVFDMLKSRGK